MAKKIKMSKIISQFSPEIMFLISQIFTALSIYNVFFLHSKNWGLTTISVSLAFAFLNITIIYFGLRPYKFSIKNISKNRYNIWGTSAFLIPFVFMMIYISFSITAIVIQTSYAAAQLIILSGSILPLTIAVCLIFTSKSPGLNRKFRKTVPIRFFLITIFLFIAASAWHVAEWNPTLKHYTTEIEITKSNGLDNIQVGDKCYADIGTYSGTVKKNRCRVRFFCNGKRLFGSLGMGMINGKISTKDNNIYIKAQDSSVKDGDPAFSINTDKELIRFSKNYSLKRKRAELTGRIIKSSPFFLYYNRNQNF